MGKKLFKGDTIGVVLLVLITLFAGYMGCTKRFNNANTSKIKTETKQYDNYGYYYDDYTDSIYVEDYNDGYYDYNYEGYRNYDYDYNNYNFGSSVYNDKTAPNVKYSSKDTIYQYEDYDPWKNVSAYHTKFGDVTDYIEITYNNLDVNLPGTYSIVYKACNYPGSAYCKTFTKEVVVKAKNSSSTIDYSKGPVWSNYSSKSCVEGSTKCSADSLTPPTAKDPYSNRELSVELINGYVDIYTPGTYVLVYYANTTNNISGTITRNITITKSLNSSYYDNDDDNYNKRSKYISNYTSSYYDDGIYRGYLNADNNGSQISKYISEYKWTNKVSYTYRCDNQYEYGTDGWTLVSTNTSDDHPTYYYNVGGFTGTLNKTGFYCVEGSGCEYDLNKNLGTCTKVGQTKNVYRNWVGLYSGYVYSNQEQTYSGYVYSY